MSRQDELLRSLGEAGSYPGFHGLVQRIDTHASAVFLVGDLAYKVKKAVDYGFLDYSTLARRKRFCAKEVRLNRRLAPQTYLGVKSIAGSPKHPVMGGGGPAIEYAVVMRRFGEQSVLANKQAAGCLGPVEIDAVALEVAEFHGRIACADMDSEFGKPAIVFWPMRENFAQLQPLIQQPGDRQRLNAIKQWTENRLSVLEGRLMQRREQGFIRECHGDLHLGNVAWVDGRPLIFDGIEFNRKLFWIDVVSDIAFFAMDLEERGARDLSRRFVNLYLETTGDCEGLHLLRLYLVYRAMVRAKVAALTASRQTGLAAGGKQSESAAYLALALAYTQRQKPFIVLMHGLSGSGKSTVALEIVERCGALRLRSDVERKRIGGRQERAGLYSAAMTEQTYGRLARLAEIVVSAGFPVVIDSTSLKRQQRDLFVVLAAKMRCECRIVDVNGDVEELRRRIEARLTAGKDASDADCGVLQAQIAGREPLTPEERRRTITVDTSRGSPARIDWGVFDGS